MGRPEWSLVEQASVGCGREESPDTAEQRAA